MRFRLAAAVFATAFATHGYARSLIVHVTSTSCKAGMLRAVAADGAAVERRWSGADVAFDLSDGVWTIEAEAPGCWAAPATSDSEPLKITLWPAATLRFRIEEPRDVLAAIDLAASKADIDRERVAIIGESLGGGNVLMTVKADPSIGPVVTDSAFADGSTIVSESATKYTNLPSWFTPGIVLMARLFQGLDIAQVTPSKVVAAHPSVRFCSSSARTTRPCRCITGTI